jgi:hypothetical protein
VLVEREMEDRGRAASQVGKFIKSLVGRLERTIGLMLVQTFRELLSQQPFRLAMSSGQTNDAHHPELAWLTRTSIFVGIDQTDEGVAAEFKIRSLRHVTAVEPLHAAESRQTGTA